MTSFDTYLREQEAKDRLRFITCGSVDDGKSTLIGRLLHETKQVFEDQLAALEKDSLRYGTTQDKPDYALLMDGLQAEREQGITIDVAYRFFATAKRRFIVADTPGHVQYTRNMATGASTADVAVILIDARKGILSQTKRHSFIVALMGIKDVILAVNKMDLVSWDQSRFEAIVAAYEPFAKQVGIKTIRAIPLSALEGDNVLVPSTRMNWYRGQTLMAELETIPVRGVDETQPFRMPVQWVNRPDAGFRGYCGTIASGVVRAGDAVLVQPSGRSATLAKIVTQDGDLQTATAGQSVTLTLSEEVDVVRGDVIAPAAQPAPVTDHVCAHLIWMSEEPMLPGRSYMMRIGAASLLAEVSELKHRVDIDTLAHDAAKTLELNQIGLCNIALNRPIAFDPYDENRETGSFILIDRLTNATAGAGMIRFSLRRATNLSWQALTINREARALLKQQKPCVLWFTGLSGAGKSTIANELEKKLHALGRHTYILDGDNVRHGLNKDLGFTDADRVENIRRVAETAKLFVDAGIIVLVSFISPFRNERQMARELFAQGDFYEIHVATSLQECESRDPKGLYKKARGGTLKNFTGIDSPYEPPEAPELTLDTALLSPEQAADLLIDRLRREEKI